MNLERVRHKARLLIGRERLVAPAFTYRIENDVAAVACTIGPALEQRVAELFRAGERLLALELDALGNERLFCLAKRALAAIERETRRRGQHVGDERYPGDPGIGIEEQPRVLEMANAAAKGIRSTPGGMLSPVKSMSFVVPLGTTLAKSRGGPCRRCPSRERCASAKR
ncbi:MAG: hypothetical protein EPO20_06520 [Betaproteobacteria bacterium]|nr:MAG: hypothetical protein EPO20_06520 [Betaproteobacteria bacterium]